MQTLTLFFGFAIVAIAMENFTAQFFHVKTSDAGAKGPQGIQSRKGFISIKYWLRGTTGHEKVIITDGKKIRQVNLTKVDQEFDANNQIITINYINDECCGPDRNVMFTPSQTCKISTGDNIPNYRSNWECDSQPAHCPTIGNTTNNLLSRTQKPDLCRVVAISDTCYDDKCKCDNCKILEDGQLCHPGNYTIEFQIKNQCEGVTFGECSLSNSIILFGPYKVNTIQQCYDDCKGSKDCRFYRYERQTKNCTHLSNQYANLCNIMAGPMDKIATECLFLDNDQTCDAEVEEDCEYDGEVLLPFRPGAIAEPDECQKRCKNHSPDCKYWIHDQARALCILKRETKKTCKVHGGPLQPSYYTCRKNALNQTR